MCFLTGSTWTAGLILMGWGGSGFDLEIIAGKGSDLVWSFAGAGLHNWTHAGLVVLLTIRVLRVLGNCTTNTFISLSQGHRLTFHSYSFTVGASSRCPNHSFHTLQVCNNPANSFRDMISQTNNPHHDAEAIKQQLQLFFYKHEM